jgi:hypothetical protein
MVLTVSGARPVNRYGWGLTVRFATALKHGANKKQSAIQNPQPKMERADDGIRTRDLRFTKPLLYQLSYVGAFHR